MPKRIIVKLPTGTPLDNMSQDQLAQHVRDIAAKGGVSASDVGNPTELLLDVGEGSDVSTDDWLARWTRNC
jgi:hypothetical protein